MRSGHDGVLRKDEEGPTEGTEIGQSRGSLSGRSLFGPVGHNPENWPASPFWGKLEETLEKGGKEMQS